MKIPDPFAPLFGSFLHDIDISIAEELTGVPGKTISGHIVEPFVQMGFRRDNSLAVFHLLLIGSAAAMWASSKRQR